MACRVIAAIVLLGSSVLSACGTKSPTSPTPLVLAQGGTPPEPTPEGDPNSPPLPRPPTPSARISRSRFLAFGDSITAGTTSPPVALLALSAGLPQSYPFKLQSLLSSRYTEQIIDVTNEGKPGEAAFDSVLRFPSVLKTTVPEVVILLHGVNDVTFLGMPGVRRVADYLNTMARDARFGGAEVVICTYPMHRAGGFRAGDPAVIAAYNRALREVARGEGALLADFEVEVPTSLVGADGLHPTEEGYSRMADTLFNVLKAEYEVRR